MPKDKNSKDRLKMLLISEQGMMLVAIILVTLSALIAYLLF